MTLFLRLAWRNVWRQRRRTLLIAVGMGFMMALLVFYDGLIGGFEQAIYGNAIQLLGGNVQVHAPGYNDKVGRKPLLPLADPDAVVRAAETRPEVVAVSKRIVTGGLVTNREGAFAVSIIGVEPEKEGKITPVAENITSGRYLNPDDGDLIVIGQGLATAMSVYQMGSFAGAGIASAIVVGTMRPWPNGWHRRDRRGAPPGPIREADCRQYPDVGRRRRGTDRQPARRQETAGW